MQDLMTERSQHLYKRIIGHLESALLPMANSPCSSLHKFNQYSLQFCKAVFWALLLLLLAPFAIAGRILRKSDHQPLSKLPFKISNELNLLPEIGVATSEYQVNGAHNFPHSTWAKWEKSVLQSKLKGPPENYQSGSGVNFWNHPSLLIEQLDTLGIRQYRLSVEWSAIEPQKGHVSKTALDYYVNLCKALRDKGIEPMVTLHHFSEPIWFEEMNGFEKEENIPLFVSFSERVFTALQPYVDEWVTINEPTCYVYKGYIDGLHPPCKTNLALAGQVLKNLIIAHRKTYERLKALDPKKQIGFSHNIMRFIPYHPFNPLEQVVCHYFTHIFHEAFMHFLQTGAFHFKIPFLAHVYFKDPEFHTKYDFFGLQYYSHPLVSMTLSKTFFISTCYPKEKMTEMYTRFCPRYLSFALEECRNLHKPIYITETGTAASALEDQKEFIEEALRVASSAIENGLPLRKLYVWTLIDNFEWALGWEKKFGLFSFDPKTRTSQLKPAGKFIQTLLKSKQPVVYSEKPLL
jgi:beta-glucosidase